jgi:hypothetical protein
MARYVVHKHCKYKLLEKEAGWGDQLLQEVHYAKTSSTLQLQRKEGGLDWKQTALIKPSKPAQHSIQSSAPDHKYQNICSFFSFNPTNSMTLILFFSLSFHCLVLLPHRDRQRPFQQHTLRFCQRLPHRALHPQKVRPKQLPHILVHDNLQR